MEIEQKSEGSLIMGKEDYILVVGSLNYDMLIKQERLPREGETYTGEGISYAGGGKGANQAVQCAKLGVPAYMAGKVGRDSFGDMLLTNLKQYGVNTELIKRSELETGVGIVHALNGGEVYATILTGANFDFNLEDVETLDEAVKHARILILQLEIPTEVVEALIQKAHAYGVTTLLNAAPAKPVKKEVLRLVDYLIVNETESSFYSGCEIRDYASVCEAKEQLLANSGGRVIVTLGSKGSVLVTGEECVYIPAVQVPHAADTTGAGDSYIGAFAYSLFSGKEEAEACRFAARVSAVTVTRVGAQNAMPDLGGICID